MRYLMVLLWLLPALVYGDETSEQYVDVDQWQVSVALGVGVKTNPLVDGDHIPLVIVPDIAYYGESFYFDNGDLGYTWFDEPLFSVSTLLRLNTERAYFSFWHPANIFFGTAALDGSSDQTPLPGPGEDLSASIDDIAARSFALDAGVQAQWYFDSGAWLSMSLFNDVSGVYKGHHGNISYAHGVKFDDWRLLLSLGVNYKSEDLVDYYYGISARDNVDERLFYQAKQSISPIIKLDVSYPINEDWQFLSFLRYESLGAGMKDSPLVNRSYTATGFVGVSYEF